MVNCRRRNALRIQELDEDLSTKDYDHRKRDNGMNKAMNAYSSDLRTIEKKQDECKNFYETMIEALKKDCSCNETFNKRIICEDATRIQNCHCTRSADSCGECKKGKQHLY